VSDKNSLPKDIIDQWPEIFKDIEVSVVPIPYIKSITVEFENGKVWEINIDAEKLKNASEEDIEDYLEAFFEEYDEFIESVDFRLDTAKVIKDIQNRTKQFLKKRK
jgi:DNA-directed RNA polymerase specialized sigma54-like protein